MGKTPAGEDPCASAADLLATLLQQMYVHEVAEALERRKQGNPANMLCGDHQGQAPSGGVFR